MEIIRHTKQLFASFLLPVVLFLVAFSATQQAERKINSGKPVIHISQATAIAIREHIESDSVHPVRIPEFMEANWQQASLQLNSKVSQHAALHIPAHVFNVFYSLITIHAP
ncbi:MAG: hypothetical protein KF763_14765 [Cyclobacteriaceae bacterium]|nr:hypothetical protein [Cyclobacteriaceae bacterium]